ncbi:MAG: PQQ-binding-like beta-propeller repeat protein [Deltaproteobacteria bacterium]|jgi:outer membrane protein assembly factor BamB|nr:PQQ-binding-like beta-propeller repeat protein [Deltaproteobacteria bacterium]
MSYKPTNSLGVRRRDFLKFAGATTLIALKPSLGSAAPGSSPGMFRGNPTHTFYGTGPVSSLPKVVWKKQLGKFKAEGKNKIWSGTGWTGTAVADENFVYVGSLDSNLYCFYKTTGYQKWSFKAKAMFKSSPALYLNRVFIGNVDNCIYCLSSDKGKLLWKYDTGSDVDSSAVIAKGRLFIGGESGWLNCFEPTTGSLVWRTFLKGKSGKKGSDGIESTPAVYGKMVFTTNYQGDIFALNINDGSIIWKNSTGDDTDVSPVVAAGKVFVAAEEKSPYIFAFDIATGKLIWKWGGWKTGGFWSTPAYSNGCIYIGGHHGRLYCLDAHKGKEKWSFKTTRPVWSSPAVVDQKVIFGSYDGYLYLLNSTSGQMISRINLKGRIISSPLVDRGNIYIGTANGRFYCLK